jgi:hypothetical protein
MELTLRRWPQLHCTVQPFLYETYGRRIVPDWQRDNETLLPPLVQLAQRCTRLVIQPLQVDEEAD